MTLGRCLEALRWNQQHRGGGNLRVVPYRESKVTHLFRCAAQGRSGGRRRIRTAARDQGIVGHRLVAGVLQLLPSSTPALLACRRAAGTRYTAGARWC